MRTPWILLALLAAACARQTTPDPLTQADKKYAQLLTTRYAALRDTSRNIHNSAARAAYVDAEKEEALFFTDPSVVAAIEKGLAAPVGSAVHTKAEAWKRDAVFIRSWKPEEREREAELLASLDEKAAAEATWVRPDGKGEVSLTGKWEEVSRAADRSSDEDRHALAGEYADHKMNMVGDDLRELVRLRNKVAKREGFETYWDLALYHRGLSPEDVTELVKALDTVIRPVNHANAKLVEDEAQKLSIKADFANRPFLARQAGLEAGLDEAEPWFDTDLAEDRIFRGLRDMGIDLPGLQIYTGPSRYTRRGAYGFPIHPPDNIAVSISIDRRYGTWEYEAYAHEAGHVFWWRSIEPAALASPVSWEPAPAYTEGFAQLFERILYNPSWPAAYIPDMPEKVRMDLATWRARQVARWVTDAIVQQAVEQRAYQVPENWGAVTRFCSEMEASYEIHAGPPPTTRDGIPYCASLLVPLIWHNPAYAQNYIFSYVTEARLYDALTKAVGDPVRNPKVGPWLADHIVREGGLTPFLDRLAKVSPDTSGTTALDHYISSAVPDARRPTP